MTTNFDKVIEYVTKFNLTFRSDIYHDIFNDVDFLKARIGIMEEEYNSCITGFFDKKIIDIIKGISTVLYSVYNFGTLTGTDMDEAFDLFLVDLTRKENGLYNQIYINLGADPSNFQKVKEIQKLTNMPRSLPIIDITLFDDRIIMKHLVKINRFFSILKNLCDKTISNQHKFQNMNVYLCKIMYYIYSLGVLFGIDMDDLFDVIHTFNMNKTYTLMATAAADALLFKNQLFNINIEYYKIGGPLSFEWVVYDSFKEIVYKPTLLALPDLSTFDILSSVS